MFIYQIFCHYTFLIIALYNLYYCKLSIQGAKGEEGPSGNAGVKGIPGEPGPAGPPVSNRYHMTTV